MVQYNSYSFTICNVVITQMNANTSRRILGSAMICIYAIHVHDGRLFTLYNIILEDATFIYSYPNAALDSKVL